MSEPAVEQAVLDRAHARGEKHYSELRPYEQAIADMTRQATDATDGFAIAAQVADSILSADDIDSVLDAANSGPGDITDLVGRTFRFIGGTLNWMKSAEKYRGGGFGVYAVFTVLLADGEQQLISTGAVNVVAQLRRFQQLGVFGTPGEVYDRVFSVACRDTANGTLFRICRG